MVLFFSPRRRKGSKDHEGNPSRSFEPLRLRGEKLISRSLPFFLRSRFPVPCSLHFITSKPVSKTQIGNTCFSFRMPVLHITSFIGNGGFRQVCPENIGHIKADCTFSFHDIFLRSNSNSPLWFRNIVTIT